MGQACMPGLTAIAQGPRKPSREGPWASGAGYAGRWAKPILLHNCLRETHGQTRVTEALKRPGSCLRLHSLHASAWGSRWGGGAEDGW